MDHCAGAMCLRCLRASLSLDRYVQSINVLVYNIIFILYIDDIICMSYICLLSLLVLLVCPLQCYEGLHTLGMVHLSILIQRLHLVQHFQTTTVPQRQESPVRFCMLMQLMHFVSWVWYILMAPRLTFCSWSIGLRSTGDLSTPKVLNLMLIAFGYACKHSDRCRQLQVNGKSMEIWCSPKWFPDIAGDVFISLVTRRILPGYTPWASACLSPGSGGNNVPRSPRARKFHINIINNFRKQRGLALQYPHLYSWHHGFSMCFPYFWHPWSPMDPWWDQFLPRSGPPERAFASLLPAHAAVLFEAPDGAWTFGEIVVAWEWLFHVFSKDFLPILYYHILMYYHILSYTIEYANLLKPIEIYVWMHLNPIDVMKIGDLDFQFRWCPASCAVSGLCGFQLGVRTPHETPIVVRLWPWGCSKDSVVV